MLVGGAGVFVGGVVWVGVTGVFVGVTGVLVGVTGVSVGVSGVLVGVTGVAVGVSGVALGEGDALGGGRRRCRDLDRLCDGRDCYVVFRPCDRDGFDRLLTEYSYGHRAARAGQRVDALG